MTTSNCLALAVLLLAMSCATQQHRNPPKAATEQPESADAEQKPMLLARIPESSTSPTPDAQTTIKRGSGPIAIINDVELSRAEYDRELDLTEERFQRAGRTLTPALERRLKIHVLRRLVDTELFRQRAAREGLTPDSTTLSKYFDEHKRRFGDLEMFEKYLQKARMTELFIKAYLQNELTKKALIRHRLESLKDIDDVELRNFYDDNPDDFRHRETIKASHILFKVHKATSDENKKTTRAKALDVTERAQKGEDFASLAKEFSEGPTGVRGGDLGKFGRGRMVKSFEEVAFALEPGQVAGPVETKLGYHVIKVFEKYAAHMKPFDEVKDSLKRRLDARREDVAKKELVTELESVAKIEVLEPGVPTDLFAKTKTQ